MRSQTRMLASNGMRLASELRSPLLPALALVGVTLFFAGDPGISVLPWIGIAALVLLIVLFATQGVPGGTVVFVPLALFAAWCAISVAWSVEPDRSWAYANRTFVYLAFALIGAYLGRETRRLLYGFSALLSALCVWTLRRQGGAGAARGIRAVRAADRADRLLERARAARRHRAADRALPGDAGCVSQGRSSSTAGSW